MMRRAVGLAGLSLALACGSTQEAPATSAVNSCPDHPCSAYVDGGVAPICSGGACVFSTSSASFGSDVLFVSMPSDALFAPDRTIAVPLQTAPGVTCTSGGTCTTLPDVAQVLGAYSVTPQLQEDILHYVLNTNTMHPSTLPVHVSYRPVWPSSSAAGGDAIGAGMPFDSVEIDSITNQFDLDSNFSGPAGGPSQMFATYLQPGYYRRVVRPQPPFDAVFPPDVQVVDVTSVRAFEDDAMSVDATVAEVGTDHPVTPTFSLTFAGSGSFDGWSTFLRDQTTKQTISNVVALSGPAVPNVVLPTNHHSSDGDALTDAELVLSPPASLPLPMAVFATQGGQMSSSVQYPALPAPEFVAGTVSAPDGTPVEADLVFESTGIAQANASMQPRGLGCTVNRDNYFYSTKASARIDWTGASTWAVELPVGQYRVSIRPLDAIPSPPAPPAPVPVFGVTVVSPFSVGPTAEACAPASSTALTVSATQQVEGLARIADGRPLSGAEVDAIPVECADGSTGASCLPRAGQAGTGDDGRFTLLLDAGGSYLLQVRPADGTRLPWTFMPGPLVVTPGSMATPLIEVPAPFPESRTLLDPVYSLGIPNAVVRTFAPDPSGRWLEVGHAVTDSSGHYEMFLAPPAQ
jgi:hypothetical protein